jgi:glycine/serine hydroxymethyltransferase
VSRSRRTGARLATHELTRQGMTEKEMGDIARLIGRAVRHSDPPSTLAGEVEALLARFPGVRYSFDGEPR